MPQQLAMSSEGCSISLSLTSATQAVNVLDGDGVTLLDAP